MECIHNNLFRIKDGRSHFWQWDTNQKLIVNWAGAEQVHYSAPGDVALVTETYVEDGNIVSDVPNILLQNEGTLKVWVCDDDATIHSQTTIVAARQRPADYVYTETDVRTWDELDERIAELEENGGGGTGGQGKPGVTFIPNVSEEGIISWENDGGLDNPEPRDITGPAGKDGADGKPGDPGQDGKSAYEIALDNGFEGTEEEWLESLQGKNGEPGQPGKDGADGLPGKDGLPGPEGPQGPAGEIGPAGPQGPKGEPGEKGDPGEPGAKGDKGDPGEPGQPGADGQDGQPGQPGQNGFSPIVSVQDIDGGHRVTITDAEGEKTFDVMDGKDGTGGSGASGLPTDNAPYQMLVTDADGNPVWEDRAYRKERILAIQASMSVTTQSDPNFLGVFVGNIDFAGMMPQDQTTITVQYDGVLYEELKIQESVLGLAAGNLSTANAALGTDYEDTGEPFVLFDITTGGAMVTTNPFESETHYFVIFFPGVYDYKMVIRNFGGLPYGGTGQNAEAFNGNNIASGAYSHAEGSRTIAYSDYAHSEGYGTTVNIESTAGHAEGYETVVASDCGHAEGVKTAVSNNSEAGHAEGYETVVAVSNYGHAEGQGTYACGRSQHVQGEWNIKDEVDSSSSQSILGNKRGKYAHIVGNGTANIARSNAHTLDWDGNAWYAGYVEGTALILPSPNGTRWRITVDDSGNLVTVVEG